MFSQQSAIGEVDLDTQIADFKSMIQKSTNPTDKAVMQSMCAEMYANYYERNRNIIHGRSNISDGDSTSLGSITKNQLFNQVFQLIDASLKPSDLLKSNNMDNFKVLLQNNINTLEHPTLFDFISQRNADILSMLIRNDNEPLSNGFNTNAMVPSDAFLRKPLQGIDSPAQSRLYTIFQKWLSFRINDKNTEATVQAELHRIKCFDELSIFNNNKTNGWFDNQKLNEKYVATLEALVEKYKNNPS